MGETPDTYLTDERNVVGVSIMPIAQPNAVDLMADIVKPSDFIDPYLGRAWGAILAIAAEGTPIDHIILGQKLGADAGPLTTEYLERLSSHMMESVSCEFWATRIARRARLRRIAAVGRQIASVADRSEPDDVDSVVNGAVEAVMSVDGRSADMRRNSLNVLQKAKMAAARDRFLSKTFDEPVMTTGLVELDSKLRITTKHLYLLGADTGHGKTAFAVHIAISCSKAATVLYITMEDPDEAIATRSMGSISNTAMDDIDFGIVTEATIFKLKDALTKGLEASKRLHVFDTPSVTCAEIEREIRRVKRLAADEFPLRAVFVDYLQLVTSEKAYAVREQELREIGDGLASMAKRHDLAMFATAQLNRAAATRADKRPVISDIRESARPAQNAKAVMFLYRPSMNGETGASETACEIIIRKNRGGKLGTAHAHYEPANNYFGDITTRHETKPRF